ncbi:hypothetical protein P691DRAFT_783791 [Macrolepiota fuliginosa MF-IS2]|uniref:Uncharacterized protein n=1 Tax=Macrolepiota fuliginosa MF-IS2 TaxID=1400762 RepID=A0A9P5WYC8_9AGAR|nr:hypothetical protein P691DRAFT_783791 [Macrolepiota fuliginosa MF-IS2]
MNLIYRQLPSQLFKSYIHNSLGVHLKADYQPMGSGNIHLIYNDKEENNKFSNTRSHASHLLNNDITHGINEVFQPCQDEESEDKYAKQVQDQTRLLTIINSCSQHSSSPSKQQQTTARQSAHFALDEGSQDEEEKDGQLSNQPLILANPFINIA